MAARVYKRAGLQGTAAVGTYGTLYNVPAATTAIISTIVVCNSSASDITYRIGVDPDGASPDLANGEFIVYDNTIGANDTITLSLGMTLEATEYLRVSSSTTDLNFQAFIMEIS